MARVELITAVTAAAIAAWFFGEARAACPIGHPDTQTEFAKSQIVAIGTVTAEKSAGPPFEGMYEGTRYTFRVAKVLKGKPVRSLSLFSENSTGRFPMDVGEKYLVFVYVAERGGRRFFAVDNCGNSGKLTEVKATLETVEKLRGYGR